MTYRWPLIPGDHPFRCRRILHRSKCFPPGSRGNSGRRFLPTLLCKLPNTHPRYIPVSWSLELWDFNPEKYHTLEVTLPVIVFGDKTIEKTKSTTPFCSITDFWLQEVVIKRFCYRRLTLPPSMLIICSFKNWRKKENIMFVLLLCFGAGRGVIFVTMLLSWYRQKLNDFSDKLPCQGLAGMTFGHLGMGTGMAQPIPKLWEREQEWKISFPTFGNRNGKIPFPSFGNGNWNSILAFREREWDIVIPRNDREWERELHRKLSGSFSYNSIF